MKAGIAFLLGLLLAFVVIFAYWLRTSHPLGTRWKNSVDRGLAHVDLAADQAGR